MPHKPQATLLRPATAVLCATLLFACRAEQPQEAHAENQSIDKSPPRRLPTVEPPFDRTRLLLAVVRAASAHTAGTTDPGAQRSLDGKQFEVRLRFGCDGPGPGRGSYGWSLDPDGRTLRVRAVPTVSLDDGVARSVAGDDVEAVEGFWLPRPWLLEAACPNGQPIAAPAASPDDAEKPKEDPAKASVPSIAAPQRIGIAQFFTAEGARTRRRMNRPFEAVKQLADGDRAGQNGFDLVLSGRLRARADGRVILCEGSGLDRPPDCIVSAAVDRVWIERPDDRAVMAEWSV
jgi:hypothetical protein